MSITASAMRRRSFKLHKAILGTALALSAFAAQEARMVARATNVGNQQLDRR